MQLRFAGTVIYVKLPKSIAANKGKLFLLLCGALIVGLVVHLSDTQDAERVENWHKQRQVRETFREHTGNAGDSPLKPPTLERRNPDVLAPRGRSFTPRKLKMAMEPALKTYSDILHLQQDIIQNQKRPADSIYNVNITYSDTLSMDRPIIDSRPEPCLTRVYNVSALPKASVIIPYYNEALSMLLRTVHSILNRTPDELLNEVILVDDRSTYSYLTDGKIDNYLAMLPKVRLLRNKNRDGLIVSRMNGARISKGPVVIFLDAHSEVNEGWLEPLLEELVKHPRSVIQPFVDGIDALTIEYSTPPSYHKGSFSWDLRYTWLRVSDHVYQQVNEYGIPFFSPTLVGCALAVHMDYFTEIGAFDEGLKVWGGENLELAFRTWMCGGQVVTVTCSRVGHVFKNFPYKFDGDKDKIVQKNLIRVAETWMDSYKKYFYAATRVYDFKQNIEFTPEEQKSLEERKVLRERLGCHSFEWYMRNVIPELEPPPMDSEYYGEVMNIQTRACFEVKDDGALGMSYFCYEHKIIPKNYFRLTTSGLLMYQDRCVRIQPPSPMITVDECPTSNLDTYGTWELYNYGTVWGSLRAKKLNALGQMEYFCIMQVTNVLPVHKGEQMPQLAGCEPDNHFQIWSFTYKFDFTNSAPAS